MDEFQSLINAFVDHTDDFDVAHEALYSMINESPDDFISNLLAIITTTTDTKLQLRCISLLTIPITRNRGVVVTINSSNIQNETKESIREILISLLNHQNTEISEVAGRVLTFYVQFASNEKQDLIKQLISLINIENAEMINIVFMKTLKTLCKGIFLDSAYSLQAAIQLCTFFSTLAQNNSDPSFVEKEKIFLEITGEFCHCISSFDGSQQEVYNVVDYMWTLTKEKYAAEGLNALKLSFLNLGAIICQIPDFI